MSIKKRNAALAALEYLLENYPEPQVIGIGTGSTVNIFIEELAKHRQLISTTVASSLHSMQLLQDNDIPVSDFNTIEDLPIYIDGADAFNKMHQLTKGHGAALFREKILAYQAKKFICLVDDSKQEEILGTTCIPLEVLPMARSAVARQIVKLHGQPRYRHGVVTDNGNIILDVFGWQLSEPMEFERKLNNIPGIVCNGIFATRPADLLIVGHANSASLY